ncbi:MotE family protein [Pseudoroseomonas globiformis]|uniref:MotE family protein n=1 Tax=Teichococcus globiformis TaxID=2307229 RepID=A0ABV7G658_9PROT
MMTVPNPPSTFRPRQGLARGYGPRLGLPLVLLGLAALVPGRLAGLWLVEAPAAGSAAHSLPAAGTAAGLVTLRDGMVARTVVAPVLAGPLATPMAMPASLTSGAGRASPIGEDRPGDGRLLVEVARRQAEIDRRERALEAREAQLRAAEALTRTQITELTRLRQEMEKLVSKESAAAEGDLDALVSLYVNMRPQQAAKVLERMEPLRAAAVLLKIPERQAGPILAQMEPPAALAVTQEIAGRREAFRGPSPVATP